MNKLTTKITDGVECGILLRLFKKFNNLRKDFFNRTYKSKK